VKGNHPARAPCTEIQTKQPGINTGAGAAALQAQQKGKCLAGPNQPEPAILGLQARPQALQGTGHVERPDTPPQKPSAPLTTKLTATGIHFQFSLTCLPKGLAHLNQKNSSPVRKVLDGVADGCISAQQGLNKR
jgi:hypothetical protein